MANFERVCSCRCTYCGLINHFTSEEIEQPREAPLKCLNDTCPSHKAEKEATALRQDLAQIWQNALKKVVALPEFLRLQTLMKMQNDIEKELKEQEKP